MKKFRVCPLYFFQDCIWWCTLISNRVKSIFKVCFIELLLMIYIKVLVYIFFQAEQSLYTPGPDKNHAIANSYAASGYVIGTLQCTKFLHCNRGAGYKFCTLHCRFPITYPDVTDKFTKCIVHFCTLQIYCKN